MVRDRRFIVKRLRERASHEAEIPGIAHVLEPETWHALSIVLQYERVDFGALRDTLTAARSTVRFRIFDVAFKDEPDSAPSIRARLSRGSKWKPGPALILNRSQLVLRR